VLALEGVEVRYGPIVALRDVSLRVSEGEVVAVLGANGAGKTTLLKTISGLLRPTKGRIEFLGHDLKKILSREDCAFGDCARS
jgi:branched-chain amino acid transport system ATP-binding protein